MEANGRPTPLPRGTTERPRFRERPPSTYGNLDTNPHVAGHLTFGRPVIPAHEAWPLRGRWSEEFGREAPLHVEIGSGNGFFLRGLTERHPDWNVIGIEIRFKRVMFCGKKLSEAGLTNGRILRYHAAFLDDLFEPGTLSGLYVNHPDPWPKERHEKNRLISRWFLDDVAHFLKPGGVFRLKSDHHPNVARVEPLLNAGPEGEPLPPLPFTVRGVTYDLHGEGAPWDDDIETNYQKKKVAEGCTIAAIALERTEGPWPAA